MAGAPAVLGAYAFLGAMCLMLKACFVTWKKVYELLGSGLPKLKETCIVFAGVVFSLDFGFPLTINMLAPFMNPRMRCPCQR